MSKHPDQKWSFLSLEARTPKSLKDFVTQTPSKVAIGSVTFLATRRRGDVGAQRSIRYFGINAVIRCN
jgi:hypothetical protein